MMVYIFLNAIVFSLSNDDFIILYYTYVLYGFKKMHLWSPLITEDVWKFLS